MKKKSTIAIIILFIAFILEVLAIGYKVYFKEYDYILIAISVIAVFLLLAIVLFISNMRNGDYVKTLENRISLWNTISYKVKKAGETAFTSLPIGVLVLNNNYDVMWSNDISKDMVLSPLQNKNLKEIANGKLYDFVVNAEKDDNSVILEKVSLFNKIYEIEYLKASKIIYLKEITDFEELQEKYVNRTLAVGYINIDNMEETLSELDVQGKSEYQGKIISEIAKWAENYGVFVRAFSDSKYLIMANREQLEKVMENDFEILDNIKYILKSTKAIRITLSMGISCADESIASLAEDAQNQLDLALNRGGDQAVVNLNGKLYFYGAKTDPTYKDSKVAIRYKYEELEKLMLEKDRDQIFVVGHRGLDADGFGACLAIYNLAAALNKDCYIILDEDKIDATVKEVYNDVKIFHQTLYKDIITPSEAIAKQTDKSLLMIVDVQAESQLLITAKELSKFKTIGLIDHHRKNDKGTVTNTKFSYIQPAASSSVELIFSLLEFSKAELKISAAEASWMLLGIVVDTNSFTYRASSTTFEVVGTLNRLQGNMASVKKYLKEDMAEKELRMNLISNMERFHNCVAIAHQTEYSRVQDATLAKVSDELLTVKGIDIAVTCGYTGDDKNMIKISSRSLDEKYNCQVLMEMLGGGGHKSAAATTIKNKTMDEVVSLVKEKINFMLGDGEDMKIIFIEDVKGKVSGKKGEIKDVKAGYANYLISNSKAVIASEEHIRILEQEKKEAEAAANKLLNEMQEVKKQIESQPVKIMVKMAADGRIQGVVTSKDIAEAIEKQIGPKIDKRKITLSTTINALGSYDVKVQLHKEVEAIISVYIIEEKK